MADDDTENAADPFKVLEPIAGTPVSPAHGVAAVALSLSLKYHGIATIQDGALYQQYKLEGRNIRDLTMDDVFETAIRMELHLIGASDRLAKIFVEAIANGLEDEAHKPSDEIAS